MNLQSKFLTFHKAVLLSNTDENAILREKRDAVLQRLRDGGLRFASFNQGSYSMGTGVQPVKADYDIDVGIVFTGVRPDDPLAAKRKVRDAVEGHTTRIEWLRHCIRVQYIKAHEPVYHVDLAVYWEDEWSRLVLAVGKEGSSGPHKYWEPADPKGFLDRVARHGSGESAAQFRRVVRYLKRWKDVHFPVEGNAAPIGVGLTVAGLSRFQPVCGFAPRTEADYDDLAATRAFVDNMRSGFQYVSHDGELAQRLVAAFPVQPHKDVFRKMTNQQMQEFRARLGALSDALQDAQRTQTTQALVRAFGADFPR
ncbi:nucleotidyltransferase [Nannocystis sp. RBIL2]|uniref:cyclic GMP-AMP synthase DncV-like nucleotidyltransferase n=1 Tax=Nannocystis sp. RBIL2 TaxID=2996788 RepID=UPI00226E6F5D|nr:nucleotidyltransferase [Nannocystis sp. RBIL2]MCY1069743.1 nucleotidyltransferase [Nannocystis sp. RBIL2]